MKYICPKCKQREGVENSIGCLVYEYLPDRRCLNCGHEWDIKRRKRYKEDDFSDYFSLNETLKT